ncbi:MAG: nuclear transport factor 2 family protein [Bacteroidota bacterium]|nr:nuclear transport factor 2 family protein [Bacteroidota bacterium]
MEKLLLAIFLIVSIYGFGQSKDEKIIRDILKEQTKAWNRGGIENFMKGYWESDSLMFIGKNGVKRGWNTTLQNYKKRYPDTASMGKLSFDIISLQRLSSQYFYLVGKWFLRRTIGNLNGYYTLLFKKINGKWLIISDHSS